jgi:putative flippase GtrA
LGGRPLAGRGRAHVGDLAERHDGLIGPRGGEYRDSASITAARVVTDPKGSLAHDPGMSTATSISDNNRQTRPFMRDSRLGRLPREIVTFALVGVASTLAYIGLYAVLRPTMPAGVANAVALVVTAVGNTAANRRLTFGVRGHRSLVRDQAAGLVAFAIALGLTGGAIGALAWLDPGADRLTELTVLVAANALATAVRFALLRGLIAAPNRLEGSPS